MAQFSVTIADAQVTRVIDGLCEAYGYQEETLNENDEMVSNPQSKGDFAHQVVANFIKNTVAAVESQKAAQEASQTVIDKVYNEISVK